MKNVTKFAVMCCMALVTVVLSGCTEETAHTEDYHFGLSAISFSGNALPDDITKAVYNYFEEKNIPVKFITFSGKSQQNCDEQAIAKFNEYTAKLSTQEIDQIGLKLTTFSFNYSVSRGGETIAKWEYSKK